MGLMVEKTSKMKTIYFLVFFASLALAAPNVLDDVEGLLEDASEKLEDLKHYHVDERDEIFDEDVDDDEVVTVGELRDLIRSDPGWWREAGRRIATGTKRFFRRIKTGLKRIFRRKKTRTIVAEMKKVNQSIKYQNSKM